MNEVLANPNGPEPDAEWIELANDSREPAELSGLFLEDGSGAVALPAVTMAGGAFALLVNEGFSASGSDVTPAPGTALIQVPSLGERGLSNAGERLVLVGREGVLSSFPAFAASHPGVSWARASLDADDGDPSSFGEQASPGASPGAPNQLAAAGEVP